MHTKACKAEHWSSVPLYIALPSDAFKDTDRNSAPPPVILGELLLVFGVPVNAPVTKFANPLPFQPTSPTMFGLGFDAN